MTVSKAASGIIAGGPPRAAGPPGFAGRLQPGNEITQALGAADPGHMHERGQPEQLRAVGQPRRPQPRCIQPGQPGSPVQRADQRVRQVPAAGIGPAADQAVPGEARSGQQQGVVAGQHRHSTRPGAAHGDHDPAGPARHVPAAHVAQIRPDQPGAGAQADQPRRPHPPSHRGLRVRQRQETGDFRRAVRLFGPFPGQRHIRRIQLRHGTPADEPQVRAQRPPRRPGQARRAPGEPLGHRRVQQHLRHRLKA
jgi:hypothetical protein